MEPEPTTDRWRTTARIAAGAQALAAVLVVVLGSVSSAWHVDPLRPVALGVLLLVPSVIALVATVGSRPPVLVVAAAVSGVLAVTPLSAHSLVFLAAAVTHLVAASRGWRAGDRLRLLPVVASPLLAVAALGAQLGHPDAACYTRLASGEVRVDRSVADATSGAATSAATSGIVEQGCTSDTVVAWEAAAGTALAAAAVIVAVRTRRPGPVDRVVALPG